MNKRIFKDKKLVIASHNKGKIIEIKDLYFQYPNSKVPVFERLNCIVRPGDIMAIKGSNGSGKSTLIKSIIRILEFNRGQVFYDAVELNQLSLEWLRENLTYLPQEPKLNSDKDVRGNVEEGTRVGDPRRRPPFRSPDQSLRPGARRPLRRKERQHKDVKFDRCRPSVSYASRCTKQNQMVEMVAHDDMSICWFLYISRPPSQFYNLILSTHWIS